MHRRSPFSTIILLIFSSAAFSAEVSLTPVKDNTLFSESDSESNGAGNYLFAGATAPRNSNAVRRALLAFDVAGNVPAGATVTGAMLTLNMSRTISANHDVSLHRVLRDWGEENSRSTRSQEGDGGPALPGDATWGSATLGSVSWDVPGGDFVLDPSDTIAVGGNGKYTWGADGELTSDVQFWLDNPAEQFGWILLGNESESRSAKRFDSRTIGNANNRPLLTIEFDEQSMVLGDFDGDGQVSAADVNLLCGAVVGGNHPADFDLNEDGNVNRDDQQIWVTDLAGSVIGDADLSGDVGFPDFLALSAQFGGEGGWEHGDFDCDGQIGFPDFLLLSQNFGASGGATAGATASVPEPSSWLLLLIGMMLSRRVTRRVRNPQA